MRVNGVDGAAEARREQMTNDGIADASVPAAGADHRHRAWREHRTQAEHVAGALTLGYHVEIQVVVP
jgi:hypothetical protein